MLLLSTLRFLSPTIAATARIAQVSGSHSRTWTANLTEQLLGATLQARPVAVLQRPVGQQALLLMQLLVHGYWVPWAWLPLLCCKNKEENRTLVHRVIVELIPTM